MFRILYVLCGSLCIINPVFGVLDQECDETCKCCKDEKCGPGLFGWKNACTTGCIDGHRGARCYELCQYENCKSCGEFTLSKVCTECYDGYSLGANKDCTVQSSQCPSNCKSCTSNTNCTECEEGFFDENGSTTCMYAQCPKHCECTTGQAVCISCEKGFFDTSTSCVKQCPVNCLTCESETLCYICNNGFYNGYEYDNNEQLLLNNCSYACRSTCSLCQSYNNCLQCIKGKYGRTCQENCSVGCKDRACAGDTGQCECTVDFTGDRCVECVVGKYGLFCNQSCSKYCKDNICERKTGFCTSGCKDDDYTGDTCNTCTVGKYGELCNDKCPLNCNENECERYGGNCSRGCKRNFDGTMCDLCVNGNYGDSCEENCPVSCAGGICEKETGFCYSCIGNYQSEMCDKCKPGYFGQHCEKKCSRQCQNETCTKDSGGCIHGCKNGYSGDRCCVESENCLNCLSNTECRICKSGFFQHSCKERCPNDCIGSCEMSTGICNGCRNNRFGIFCNFNCSLKCKSVKRNGTSCEQFDGACISDCEDGYYGPTCSKACSSLCVGNVCGQEAGICINGCDGDHDEPECVPGTADAITITAALGSLLALAIMIIIVQPIIKAVLRRRKLAERSLMYENQRALQGTNQETSFSSKDEKKTASSNETTVYEDVKKVADADHEYQRIQSMLRT